MKAETNAAIDYLIEKLGHVTNCHPIQNLAVEQKAELKSTLDELISQRFIGHWYPEKPLKGSAFRCLQITADEGYVHPLLIEAFQKVGVSTTDLLRAFDKGLSIWIDPNEVSCQHGRGAIFPVYKKIAEQKADAAKHSSSTPNAAANLNAIMSSWMASPEDDKQRSIRVRPNSTPPAPSSSSRLFYGDQQQKTRSNTPPGLSTGEPRLSALNPNAKVFTFAPAVMTMAPSPMLPPIDQQVDHQQHQHQQHQQQQQHHQHQQPQQSKRVPWPPMESEQQPPMYYNQPSQSHQHHHQHNHQHNHQQAQHHHQAHHHQQANQQVSQHQVNHQHQGNHQAQRQHHQNPISQHHQSNSQSHPQQHHQSHPQQHHQQPQQSQSHPQWKKPSHSSQNQHIQPPSHVAWQPDEHYNKYHWTRTSQ